MTRGDPIRIVLIDDHPVVLAGLGAILGAADGLVTVGEAATAEAAIGLVTRLRPDVAVMDASLPGNPRFDLVERCRARHAALRVLVLTVHEEVHLAERLLRAGAAGYLLKRSAATELVHALRCVAAGGVYVDPVLAGRILAAAPLSPRETAVLRLVAQGLSGKEVAGRMALSPKTVDTYRARAAEKIGARNRADIVRFGVSQGWLAAP